MAIANTPIPGTAAIDIDLSSFTTPQQASLQSLLTQIKRNDDAILTQVPTVAGYLPLAGGTLTGDLKGTTGEFSGLLQGAGGFSGTLLTLSSAAPGTPVASTLYKNLIPKGWVNFKDVSGTITVNAQVNCTVGFRSGTAAGDYTLTLATAEPDTFWVVAGVGVLAGTASLIVSLNETSFSHTASVLNFITATLGGVLTRPSEAHLLIMGN